MKGNRAALTIIVILVLVIAGWWLFKRSGRGASVDLLSTFSSAEKKPVEGTFQITEVFPEFGANGKDVVTDPFPKPNPYPLPRRNSSRSCAIPVSVPYENDELVVVLDVPVCGRSSPAIATEEAVVMATGLAALVTPADAPKPDERVCTCDPLPDDPSRSPVTFTMRTTPPPVLTLPSR